MLIILLENFELILDGEINTKSLCFSAISNSSFVIGPITTLTLLDLISLMRSDYIPRYFPDNCRDKDKLIQKCVDMASTLNKKVFYNQSQKNQALETLYALNENFSNYDYWVGKSYLLIADIFISMNEGFQANATLESLIDNTDIDEIRIKALELKNNIDLNE